MWEPSYSVDLVDLTRGLYSLDTVSQSSSAYENKLLEAFGSVTV
jgi:hypothetical protein